MDAERRGHSTLSTPFSYGGFVGGLVFFGFSLTPTLLPRSPLLQGFVSGLSLAAGYGVGALVWWGVGKAVHWRPTEHGRRIAWLALAAAGIAFVVPALYVGGVWNDEVRRLMTLDPMGPWSNAASLPIALLIWYLLLLLARQLRRAARALGRLFARRTPRWAALLIGAALVALPLVIVVSVLLSQAVKLADTVYSSTNATTAPGVVQPTSPMRSGSPESLVSWQSLGFRGRSFVAGGPDAATLEQYSGRPAEDPIRVYVGVDSAPTAQDRAALAVKELERTDAFSRAVLVVMGTTGTGWLEPQSADSIEYMWNGDTALVSIQYSYLPSWISFLVDTARAQEAGEALFSAVHARWSQLPADGRPKLIAYGLSLGSLAQQSAFGSVAQVRTQTDGAVFIGTPNATPLWRSIERSRDPGSPEWQPIVGQGQGVRFAASAADYAHPTGPWDAPRLLYLQHASDPVVWWYWNILWSRPDWLSEPRGPDVSPRSVWFPFVSFVQVTVDQFHGTGVPNGHGHNYGSMMVSAWAQITGPPDWTDQDTARLQQLIDGYKIE